MMPLLPRVTAKLHYWKKSSAEGCMNGDYGYSQVQARNLLLI